jgi:hypothetical protein
MAATLACDKGNHRASGAQPADVSIVQGFSF